MPVVKQIYCVAVHYLKIEWLILSEKYSSHANMGIIQIYPAGTDHSSVRDGFLWLENGWFKGKVNTLKPLSRDQSDICILAFILTKKIHVLML